MKLIYGQVEDQPGFQAVVTSELRELGIKVQKAGKCASGNTQQVSTGVFGGCLTHLPCVSVPQNGFVLQIPRFLLMANSVIRRNLKAEGLFRKGGSIQRQKELKQLVESGADFENANVHDVANVVKQFLRCLSEPLIQPRLQDSFVKAYDLSDSVTRRMAIFLLCALLPVENLHVLRFLMALFAEVASYTTYNKMDSNSLAIVLMPNLFILPEELDRKDKNKDKLFQKQTGVVRFLIDNYSEIGSVGDHILDRVRASINLSIPLDDDLQGNLDTRAKLTAKKKRNSLNGVFDGLRKMVQHGRIPSMCNDEADISDGSLVERTPSQATKRKLVDKSAAQCSSAKKRTMMQLRSEKLRPIPMTHLDSPDPAVLNEDEVFSSPASFMERKNDADLPKRKSGRIKFFGKTYMTRRNSTSRSPKPAKTISKESYSASKMQTTGRHVKAGCLIAASPNHLSVPRPQPSQTSNRTIMFKKERNAESTPVCLVASTGDSNLASIDPKDVCKVSGHKKWLPAARSQTVASANLLRKPTTASAKAAATPLQQVDRKAQSGANKWHQASSTAGKVGKLDSSHRTRSFVSDPAASVPSERFATPLRTVIWRPLTKSSLRRGRPNTVRAGLPVPSPFKGPSTDTSPTNPRMVHYTSEPGPMVGAFVSVESPLPVAPALENYPERLKAVVADIQKVLFGKEELDADGITTTASDSSKGLPVEIHDLHLPRSDSGVFESIDRTTEDGAKQTGTSASEATDLPVRCGIDVNVSHKTVQKSPSVDSGYNHGDCEKALAKAGVEPAASRLTASMTLPAESLESPRRTIDFSEPPQRPVGASEGQQIICAEVIEWKSAVDVFRGRGGIGNEEAAAGRPSLLQLMKDKAGNVTATARRYDEIASASRSAAGTGAAIQVKRRLSLKSASPMVHTRVLHHRRSVSRDAVASHNIQPGFTSSNGSNSTIGGTAPGVRRRSKTWSRESKENLPQFSRGESIPKKENGAHKAAARVALTPSIGQNVRRKSNAPVGRSKSERTYDGRSPEQLKRTEVLRKSPRLHTRAKLNVVRGQRSSTLQRRSTSL